MIFTTNDDFFALSDLTSLVTRSPTGELTIKPRGGNIIHTWDSNPGLLKACEKYVMKTLQAANRSTVIQVRTVTERRATLMMKDRDDYVVIYYSQAQAIELTHVISHDEIVGAPANYLPIGRI